MACSVDGDGSCRCPPLSMRVAVRAAFRDRAPLKGTARRTEDRRSSPECDAQFHAAGGPVINVGVKKTYVGINDKNAGPA